MWPSVTERARARTTDPETSHEAADSVKNLRAQQFKVLLLFGAFPEGKATDTDLLYRAKEVGLQISDSGLRTRRSELVRRGLVVDTGEKDFTPSGRRTRVWQAVDFAEIV